MQKYIKRLLLLGLFIGIIMVIRSTGIQKQFTLENLKLYRTYLQQVVHSHYTFAAIAYVCLYIFITTFSIPIAVLLTITGGLLFGAICGTILTNIGATIGAAFIFLMIRYFLGNYVQSKYHEQLQKFNSTMQLYGENFLR